MGNLLHRSRRQKIYPGNSGSSCTFVRSDHRFLERYVGEKQPYPFLESDSDTSASERPRTLIAKHGQAAFASSDGSSRYSGCGTYRRGHTTAISVPFLVLPPVYVP